MSTTTEHSTFSEHEEITSSSSNSPPLFQPYYGPAAAGDEYYDPSALGYSTATSQPRSTHQIHPSAPPPAILYTTTTPSPPNSNSSVEASCGKDVLFRPVEFESCSGESHHRVPLLSLTPPDSVESSTSSSSASRSLDEEHVRDALLVQTQPNAVDSKPDEVTSPPPAHGITVNLLDRELWKTFMSVGNEMIVTKPGR